MLEELLAGLVSEDEAAPLLDAAKRDRELARLAYAERDAGLSKLGEQVAAGIWLTLGPGKAVARAKSDRFLLNMSADNYIAVHGGASDLDNEYQPLLAARSPVLLDDIAASLAFLGEARNDDAELWFFALQAEARAYLHQARGDCYLHRSLDAMERLEAMLLALAGSSDPYASRNILVHAAIVTLYYERSIAWRVEAAYRRFLASLGDDSLAGWRKRAEADPEYEDATSNAMLSIAAGVRDALRMRNPSDRSEIDRLEALLPPEGFVPSILPFDPDVVALPDLPVAAFQAAVDVLTRIVASLSPPGATPDGGAGSRPASVLQAWAAFARRGLLDFPGLAEGLAKVALDDEALGIVVRALRGEARYRMGHYEEAYLDLLRAESAARAALGRRVQGGDQDASTWSRAERDAVARLVQKAGNALLAIGDEERACRAYGRAAELAVDPLSHAGALVNQGNLFFLRNSMLGEQGYISLDATARLEFVLHGPGPLIASVVGRHVTSLCEAEWYYRAALEELNELAPGAPGAQRLVATCRINLGNVAWAWGRTLAAEAGSELATLPLGDGFSSEMLTPTSKEVDCYQAAVENYQAGLAALGIEGRVSRTEKAVAPDAVAPDAVALVATALSSLSEMRYLIAHRLLSGGNTSPLTWPSPPEPHSPAVEVLHRGLTEAHECLALLSKEAAALHPDLAWRTNYNLARLSRLLGRASQAGVYFRRAIRIVERLRGALRMDAFQVAFLHDKHDVYEGYIDFLIDQNPVANIPRIFAVFERSRARAFMTLLQAVHVQASIPESLRVRAETVLAQVSSCNEAIQAAVAADNRPETERLVAEQQRLALAWADLQTELAEAHARTGRLRSPIPRLTGFQAALAADQAYLGIMLGDEVSFALLIDRTSARVFRLPSRRNVELLALPVLTYLTWSNAETAPQFRAANVALTEALLGTIDASVSLKSYLSVQSPEGDQLKHLLVSPDGMLCYLPLDALLADRAGLAQLPDTADYPDFRPYYLLSLADLSYVPSASAWLDMGRRKRQPSRAGLMAVYNVLYDTPEPPLWAVAEQILLRLGAVTSPPDMARITQAVSAAWPQSKIVTLRGRTDDGTPEEDRWQSTESNFLRVAPDARARIVLFHGHGIYNDRYPSLSGLVFNLAPTAGATGRAAIPTREDGFLRVEELFKLDLPGVEMTLLAACQTALGAYRRGEGLNALVRAFLYRGSPAVMATLWEVRADMTAFLLRVFFRMLGEEPHTERARLFSRAKRKAIPYVANLCLPYFWAPYVLWGHTAPAGASGSSEGSKAG